MKNGAVLSDGCLNAASEVLQMLEGRARLLELEAPYDHERERALASPVPVARAS